LVELQPDTSPDAGEQPSLVESEDWLPGVNEDEQACAHAPAAATTKMIVAQEQIRAVILSLSCCFCGTAFF
jgi:hypothetical protein